MCWKHQITEPAVWQLHLGSDNFYQDGVLHDTWKSEFRTSTVKVVQLFVQKSKFKQN